MQGELVFTGPSGWKPSEGGTVWVLDDGTVDEAGGFWAGLQIPSAQDVLQNSWPLVLMWPVLFLFYQGELALGLDV